MRHSGRHLRHCRSRLRRYPHHRRREPISVGVGFAHVVDAVCIAVGAGVFVNVAGVLDAVAVACVDESISIGVGFARVVDAICIAVGATGGIDVAQIVDPVVVVIGIGIVADAIAIGIGPLGAVIGEGVGVIGNSVAIEVVIASVDQAVPVEVALAGVVTGIGQAVATQIDPLGVAVLVEVQARAIMIGAERTVLDGEVRGFQECVDGPIAIGVVGGEGAAVYQHIAVVVEADGAAVVRLVPVEAGVGDGGGLVFVGLQVDRAAVVPAVALAEDALVNREIKPVIAGDGAAVV